MISRLRSRAPRRGALADAFGLEVIGLAILVFTLLLLALHEGFTRQGHSESPRTISAAP